MRISDNTLHRMLHRDTTLDSHEYSCHMHYSAGCIYYAVTYITNKAKLSV